MLSTVPGITEQEWFIDHYLAAVPFRATALLLPVGIFLTMFVIRKPIALLVPVVGVLLGALLLRYAAQFPNELSDTVQPSFGRVVWNALKDSLPTALIVSGFGFLAALYWAPRAGIDGAKPEVGPARELVLVPPRREVITAFLAIFALASVPDLIGIQHFDGYALSIVTQTLNSIATVLLFFVIFTVNRWWAAVFPLLVVGEAMCVLLLHDFCSSGGLSGGFECVAEVGEFVVKYISPAYVVLFFAALLAAQWARPTGEQPPELEPDPAD